MLWIVLFHYTYRITELYPNVSFPFQFNNGGQVGVLFFFVISGFFLGKSLLNSEQLSLKKVCGVIVNKYWRLWSSYVIAVIVIFIITTIIPLSGRTVGIREFLINCLFIYHPKVDYVDSAHWFIAHLVVIQTILSFFLLIKKKFRGIAILVYEAILIGILCTNSYLDDAISGKLMWVLCVESSLMVMIGYNLYQILDRGELTNIVYICILIFYFSITISVIWVPIYSAVTIGALFYNKIIRCLKLLAILGDFSFSWYLIHQNIGYVIILSLLCLNNSIISLIISMSLTFGGAFVIQFFVNKLPSKIIRK